MSAAPVAVLRFSRRFAILLCCLGWLMLASSCVVAAEVQLNWYKGNTHCHTYWSDGKDFPESVVSWYKTHGYDFLAVSDHNILMRGERWRPMSKVPKVALEKRIKHFGKDDLEFRGEGEKREVRLKTLAEIRQILEEPGKFLMIENEEITDNRRPRVHMNVINIAELIKPQREKTTLDKIRHYLRVVDQQAKKFDRTIFTHINHPNYRKTLVPPETLAQVREARAVEICNNTTASHNLSSETFPNTEKKWDIANTIRLAQLKISPLLGVASDDAHHYYRLRPTKNNPGRGWIVVRAAELSTPAIVDALERGDFYASNGVVLKGLDYDPEAGTLRVKAKAKPGVKYTIEFVGTLADEAPTLDLEPPGKEGRQYPPEVGKVLASSEGPEATYKLTGKELFVRAVVRSDRRMADPPAESFDMETAWTQPVGWQKWLDGASR